MPGDILVLAEGDAVAADGRLIEAATLTVAEASLTGESEPVLKDAATLAGAAGLGDRVNMVFSGTAVARGRGRAIVTATAAGVSTTPVPDSGAWSSPSPATTDRVAVTAPAAAASLAPVRPDGQPSRHGALASSPCE